MLKYKAFLIRYVFRLIATHTRKHPPKTFLNRVLPETYILHKQVTMRETKIAIDQRQLEVSAEILRAVNHVLRMEILAYIDQNEGINVNKIYSALNLEQSITSQHLRILRLAGLVNTERNGKYIYYSVNYENVNKAVKAVNRFLAEDGAMAEA